MTLRDPRVIKNLSILEGLCSIVSPGLSTKMKMFILLSSPQFEPSKAYK